MCCVREREGGCMNVCVREREGACMNVCVCVPEGSAFDFLSSSLISTATAA